MNDDMDEIVRLFFKSQSQEVTSSSRFSRQKKEHIEES